MRFSHRHMQITTVRDEQVGNPLINAFLMNDFHLKGEKRILIENESKVYRVITVRRGKFAVTNQRRRFVFKFEYLFKNQNAG